MGKVHEKVISGLDIDWIGRMDGGLEVALSRMHFGRFPAIDWDRKKREGGRDKREITHSTKR